MLGAKVFPSLITNTGCCAQVPEHVAGKGLGSHKTEAKPYTESLTRKLGGASDHDVRAS